MFFLLYNHTDDGVFLMIFQRFPKNFQVSLPGERSWTFSEKYVWKFLKISKDFWRLPKAFEEDPKMFWSYTTELMYNLRDKLDIGEIIDIFTSEDAQNMPLESQM